MQDHVRMFEAYAEMVGPVAAPVPVRDRLVAEAEAVLRGHEAGTAAATVPLRFSLPDLRGATVDEILARPVTADEARKAIADLYWFPAWEAVESSAAELDPDFEAAADAIPAGRLDALRALLERRSDLVGRRSPYGHGCTLLHYVSANGVETWRQRTPANIVEIARLLLEAGAEVDALAGSYGGGPHATTLCLTVSSGHPADAGLQGALAETLLDAGAALEGTTDDGMPLTTALAFGYGDTAELLVRRGARIRSLPVAAGLDRVDVVRSLLEAELEPWVDPFSRRVEGRQALLDRALIQAARPALTEVSRVLLEAGADPNATYEHARTPLHWVAYRGNRELAELLVEHGGDPARPDSYYGSPPSVWAREGGHAELAAWLDDVAAP